MNSIPPNQSIPAEDIGRFDNNSEDLSISKNLLMECAGIQVVEATISHFDLSKDETILIFCGTGNNGGDGFVAARHFASRGYKVIVYLCGSPHKIRTPEALLNWKILNNLLLSVKINIIKDSSQVETFLKEIVKMKSGLIVDALLGTGISGKVREPITSTIHWINKCSIPIVSIDIPSGMDPNTGKIPDIAVNCNYRVTFHREKMGLSSDSNKTVRSIGIPLEAELFVGKGDLIYALKPRPKVAHKGQYGKLLIIGGSMNYAGAPTFAALAGIEFGLDLVIVFVPKSIDGTIRAFSPNLIVRSGKSEIFTTSDLVKAKELAQWADSVVIGPGLGNDVKTVQFCQEMIRWLDAQKIPTVIDADAIKVLAQMVHDNNFRLTNPATIITPHQRELKRILEYLPPQIRDVPSDIYNFMEHIAPKLHQIGGIYIYKGKYDIILNSFLELNKSDRSDLNYRQIRLNTSGAASMTVGGTGDVLAGLSGSFLAIKNDPFESAISSAYMNGKLGEISDKKLGHRISATDMINEIRKFLKIFINL
ncbi:MAG: bifunctional ADP-dependent NAD(P)H-hydrate dehydratase/NAD(P)H-hydrate epimerase [Promethearchaeia archaeon]|nr:MAG: bifunctional ADP-dependent NAD(P)H-hydrate dehydratase/NAD(P)H-hydrate epimerase [Candidatus Lokiarchaeia archaeon]